VQEGFLIRQGGSQNRRDLQPQATSARRTLAENAVLL
jgi:hypothetical protein